MASAVSRCVAPEVTLPLHVIAGQLGHASTGTTDTYLAKLMPSDRIKAMRAAG